MSVKSANPFEGQHIATEYGDKLYIETAQNPSACESCGDQTSLILNDRAHRIFIFSCADCIEKGVDSLENDDELVDDEDDEDDEDDAPQQPATMSWIPR